VGPDRKVFTVIVALSRFRVANGFEDAVRDAFLNRPGLVDRLPGFLGLETFTDTEDRSLYYLLTRWTDEPSFRQWHSSPAHHESHQGIPKGLKLDPSFTLVRTLDRISGAHGALPVEAVRDSASVISEFLGRSPTVCWIILDSGGIIAAANPAAAQMIGRELGSMVGQPVWSFLTEPDAACLRSAIESPGRAWNQPHLLNFVGPGDMPLTLRCLVERRPDGFVLIGEAVREHEMALERELLAMNKRLAVLLRENARKSKALRKTSASAEKALQDLQDSHWLLKKIQEVLPICMYCGKVQTSEWKWEEVADYLRKNSLFLSHGFCPDCDPACEGDRGAEAPR
jgi:heme oxygenase (mycobilin-producing)